MRLKEIEKRLAAIKNELTTRAAELKEEEITALENEVTALQEERAAIKAAAEKRSALLARIAAGESVGDGEGDGSGQQRVLRNFKGAAGEGDNDDKYGSMEYRKAFNVSSAYKLPSAVFTDKSALIASAIFLGVP